MIDPFAYIAPNDTQRQAMELLARTYSVLYDQIMAYCPDNTERETALERLREARMWTNAAVVFPPRGEEA